MKCADPKLCYTTESNTKILRHFSLATPIFKKMAQQVFNCDTCIFCRKRRSIELACRCVLHASLYTQNCFLTLTYDPKQQGFTNELQYKHIQKLTKDLRAFCDYYYDKKIQVFNVHEYGKKGQKHWHLIVFNHDFSQDPKFELKISPSGYYNTKRLELLWPYGHHSVGSVTEASAMYQAQYCQKDFKNNNLTNGKSSNSQHSGIGKEYFLKHYKQLLTLGYVPINNRKLPLPRYFQKLAHKHYCHFYDKSYFFDYPNRKKSYSIFKPGFESKEIADLFIFYKERKLDFIQELSKNWDDYIDSLNLIDNTKPDFKLSEENFLHDLRNKTHQENF